MVRKKMTITVIAIIIDGNGERSSSTRISKLRMT